MCGRERRRTVSCMAHPSASFSATVRVRLADHPGSFARLAAAIGENGGSLGAIDLVRVERSTKVRDVGVLATDAAQLEQIVEAIRRVDGIDVDARLRPDVPGAPRRQDRGRPQGAAEDARRPLDGLYARRRPSLPGDRRRPGQGMDADDEGPHGRRRHRRLCGARARRHRPRGGVARDGGEGHALQGIRRGRRVPDLPGDPRRRRDRRRGLRHRSRLRRHQPRGHLGAALLRNRSRACARSSTSRCSTTTSTARRSSCSLPS